MPVYKFKDGRKGWYFQGYFKGKKYKKERYNGIHMDTKVQAAAFEQEYLKELQYKFDCKNDPKNTLLFKDAFNKYMEFKKPSIKLNTIINNTFMSKYFDCLNDLTLSEITSLVVDEWKQALFLKDICVAYKNSIISTLDTVFEWCIINYDLSNKIRAPLQTKYNTNIETTQKEDVVVYTLDEFNQFISTFEVDSFYYILFKTLFYTGLRIGELLALQIEDFKDGTLSISKTLIQYQKQHILQSPKTKNSFRTIYLNNEIIELLTKLKGDRTSGFLFGDEKTVVWRSTLKRICDEHSKQAGLPRIKIHGFRKSHATYLKDLGFDAYSIAARLGNTPEMSNDVYIKSHEEDQVKIINEINEKNSKN